MNLFKRPLFVGAHVDDVELFAGGTIARFASDCRVLAFSRHRGVYESPPEEFADSMDVLGVEQFKTLDLQACQPGEASMMWNRDALYDTLAEYKDWATIVVTHQSTDTNQDHKQVHDEVLRCFRGTPVICGAFPYNDVPMADRRFFVRLAVEHVNMKRWALDKYESQRMVYRQYLTKDAILAQLRFWGQLANCEYAEAFEVVRMWI